LIPENHEHNREGNERRWKGDSALRVLERLSNQDVGIFPDMVNVV